MKNTILSILVAIGLIVSAGAQTNTNSSFQYNFLDVYSTNALQYIVAQSNIQRSSENGTPASGVSYWNPITNGQIASLTFQFTFSQPTTSIYLDAGGPYSGTIATYNFGGGNIGSGSLLASTNGTDWSLLGTAPAPSGVTDGLDYAQYLPNSLTGATNIWFQVQLETTGDNTMAQFLRQDTSWDTANIFSLTVTTQAVPESSTYALVCIGAIGMVITLRRKKTA